MAEDRGGVKGPAINVLAAALTLREITASGLSGTGSASSSAGWLGREDGTDEGVLTVEMAEIVVV